MSYSPLAVPEAFRSFALTRNADVCVEHLWGAEIDGEYFPESWHITLFREQQMKDGRIWVRCIDMPDDVEERTSAWGMELDLLDAAWAADVEEQGL